MSTLSGELIEVVNYWACNQRGRLDREKFRALLAAYQMNRPLLHTDWPAVLDSGYGRNVGMAAL